MSDDAFIDHILSLKKQVSAYGQEGDRLCGEIAKRDAEITRLRDDRRERIATACLAGMLANSSYDGSSGTFNGCAYDAVMFADALIARLDKEAKP
jgi:hypothetical protein